MGLSKKECEALGLGDLFPDGKSKGKRKPAHVPGQMNRTESRYAEGLEAQRLLGEIRSWAFEPDKLQLGPEMTFTPDFKIVALNGDVTYVDVKGGYIYEDATCKIKAAAAIYPQYAFAQVQWKNGEWKTRTFRSGKGEPC